MLNDNWAATATRTMSARTEEILRTLIVGPNPQPVELVHPPQEMPGEDFYSPAIAARGYYECKVPDWVFGVRLADDSIAWYRNGVFERWGYVEHLPDGEYCR